MASILDLYGKTGPKEGQIDKKGKDIDIYCDKAEKYANIADSLNKDNSEIYVLKSIGTPLKNISTVLGKDVSTISREIKRNTGDRGYRYKQADAKAIERRKNASSSPKKLTPANVAVIEEKLLNDWSPEQISGRLEIEGIVNISPFNFR